MSWQDFPSAAVIPAPDPTWLGRPWGRVCFDALYQQLLRTGTSAHWKWFLKELSERFKPSRSGLGLRFGGCISGSHSAEVSQLARHPRTPRLGVGGCTKPRHKPCTWDLGSVPKEG